MNDFGYFLRMYQFKHETEVDADAESTFAWFEHEGSFRRLMPPWEVAEAVSYTHLTLPTKRIV